MKIFHFPRTRLSGKSLNLFYEAMASVTAPIVHSDDEQDDIADFASYTDEMHNSIRLKSGINVQ